MADNLFASAARDELSRRAPLAARMRPTTLDEIVGQDHLLGPGKPLRVLIERDRLSSAIVWGPAGTGKTTLANVIARATAKAFVALSAVTATVKDVRETVAVAQDRLGQHGQGTILFLDEVHRFNKAQQDALLPAVESGVLVLIGATTENPFFEVNPPLLSRSTLFRLEPLDDDAIAELLRRGLALERATVTEEALAHLITIANGDGRHALTTLEVAIVLASSRPSTAARAETAATVVELVDAEAAAGAKSLRYGEDEHYDVISAFIKSIRGSDADAGLYWLARMLEAGEDARFIARRLVILASEDIGMADPTSLLIANAAAHAIEFVGLPEAQLNLSQAVVHLATAPKSNRSYLALSRAQEAAKRTRGAGLVPGHLRDAHYKGAAKLGHGKGYVYPHDDPTGWVAQNYRPAEVADDVYYEPSDHGHESVIAERLGARPPRNSGEGISDERH
ncbi:MAG TPA: replication-associated recombination protein A [Acidimicrobiales bacterium]|nr:replication-associated recombination protein A [Acidimicrobiales bacterium]